MPQIVKQSDCSKYSIYLTLKQIQPNYVHKGGNCFLHVNSNVYFSGVINFELSGKFYNGISLTECSQKEGTSFLSSQVTNSVAAEKEIFMTLSHPYITVLAQGWLSDIHKIWEESLFQSSYLALPFVRVANVIDKNLTELLFTNGHESYSYVKCQWR